MTRWQLTLAVAHSVLTTEQSEKNNEQKPITYSVEVTNPSEEIRRDLRNHRAYSYMQINSSF